MAQTIAMVRGTTTCSSGSVATLFTQSTGTATRVIVNMISCYGNTQFGSPSINVNFVSSSGGSSVLAYFKNNTSIYSAQFMPVGNGTAPASFQGATATTPIIGGTNSNVGTSYIGAQNPNTFTLTNTTGNNQYSSYCPSNFWMGPSDYITIRVTDANSSDMTVAYSFTTITES